LFARITPRYELVNILLSVGMCFGWRRRTVAASAVRPGDAALDLCCGTGALAAQLAECVGPGGRVVGLDFCSAMLDEGRRLFGSRFPQLQFVEGDAHTLPFPDATWQAVTMAFGLRNLDDPERSLRDIARVLSPDGRVLILELTRPQAFPLKQLYHPYLRWIVPLIGGLVSGDWEAYRYLSRTISTFMGVPTVVDLMRQVGFRDVVAYPLSGGICTLLVGRR
jgi:demethylmenaquinone methyltransferase/2-methoxy-6-polyprenyl-1,4-benzoquinol methylase